MAATRAFVKYALTDRKARDLLDWMSDIKVPDEHFFQTLNHNPQNPAPGSFSGVFVTIFVVDFFSARRIGIARTMMSQDGCPPVRRSAGLTRAGITSKSLNVVSKFQGVKYSWSTKNSRFSFNNF